MAFNPANPNINQVSNLVNGYLKVHFIQEAFNQIIVHREDVELKRLADFQDELGQYLKICLIF